MARDWVAQRSRLLDYLERQGYLKSPGVRAAMESIDRRQFVPSRERNRAYDDTPLPIGQGQTISAPHMCAMMLEELRARPGAKVLEIGSGSGYHAALASRVVGPEGHIHTVERIEALAEGAQISLAEADITNVTVHLDDGSLGWPKEAPYDHIMVTCGAPAMPPPLLEQLKDGGRLVVPVGNRYHQRLLTVTRRGDSYDEESTGGVAFVPLIGEHGFDG